MLDKANDDVTALLAEAGRGDERARARLADVVYHELHRLAHAVLRHGGSGQTMCTTALVNESWLRIVGDRSVAYESRGHFYRTAARAMRTILVDYARERNAQKRGSSWRQTALDDVVDAVAIDRIDLIALDEAMRRLESLSPRRSQVVELRFFGGLSIEQTALAMGVSHGTVENDWRDARLWLRRAIAGEPA